MKMARGESSLRMPKEATCDVECAMKVEEIRIMSKKRKQSQRVVGGNGALASKGGANNSAKAAKRSLSNSNGCGAGTHSAKSGGGGGSVPPPAGQLSAASVGAAAPNLSKASSASAAGGGGGGGGKDSKDAASRRRFVWSVPLHQDFVAAVFDVGLKCASPKLLLEMMPVVDGLTSEHIKSHLQKYRLHRQRSREEFLKSYNYLTDLDGGKSLGGGSAAATVAKAAAAAAGGGGGGGGDVKDFSPGGGPDAETPGCGSSCDCVDTSKLSGGSGIGGGSSSLAEADGRGEAARSKSTTGFAETASGDEGAEGSGGGAKASAQLAGGGTEAVGGAQRLQLPGEAAAGEVVNGALLLSHLELLAKGIDMQVKFHNHLREVVESQQQLQVQLVRQQGREHLPQHPAEFSGGDGGRMPRAFPSSAAGTTTATAAPAVGFCPPSDLQYAGSIVGAEGNNRVPKEVHLVGGGGGRGVSTAGYSSNLSDSSSLVWSGGGEDKLAGSPKEAEQGGRGAAAAERPRRRERPGALNHAGASQRESAAAADASMDSACAAASKARQSVADHMRGDGTGEHLVDAQQQQQFDPAAMREAFSVQAGAGRVAPSHSQGLSGRHGAGLAPRGYVPGDYTLTLKAPEDGGAGGVAPHARGQPAVLGAELLAGEGALGAHKSIFAARSPAKARAALAAAALGPMTSTANASNGQETLTLQRHMQAQMSMQQSMLSACNDQATNFGQRGWCGGGGPAAAVATPAFGEAGGGALRGGGGAGKEGGGNGDGAGADLGNKEQQRLDSLSLQPSDAGDPSAMMGLLHQDDMFDFGMLDREGELKSAPGDSTPPGPAVARPNGDEHSTLFSFLME